MDEIKDYVDRMFTGLPKTKAVLEMKQNILENMQDHYEELLSQGKSKNEALGAVISQFGNMDEIKKELGMEDSAEERLHFGFLETFFAYFLPDALFFRILIRRNVLEAIIFFLTVAAYLTLGFTLNLWHPGWIVLWAAGLIILFLQRRKGSAPINYKAEVASRYGFLESIFAYLDAPVLFWRILIRRNLTEAAIYFSALAVHLALGFTLNLWPFSWIAYPVAGIIILMRQRHEESKEKSFSR